MYFEELLIHERVGTLLGIRDVILSSHTPAPSSVSIDNILWPGV